ncbi:MAG: YezD family protein [candidate division Zixibacteria bacterium]|nr:YezD family protein [candidate division Zixibacteria bacterium]
MEKAISNFKINEEELLSQILKAIRSIRYGYVQIIVQDSKVVQIDKTEKIRFDREMGGNG